MENAFLEMLRDQTDQFIAMDPTEIQLVPRASEVVGPGGGLTYVRGTARAAIQVKLIHQGGKGISQGEGGTDFSYEYVVLAAHGTEMAVGDTFLVSGKPFIIESMVPTDGYQVKGYARQNSKAPTDG